jgi:methionyl-tRNA formyltransferase
MRIVFFGTPYYVVPVLQTLHKSLKEKGEKSPIAAIVTQKPRPAGRKKQLAFSEVDHWAHKHKIPKFYLSEDIVEKNIKADIGVLAAYGQIIPKEVINYFPKGILNIHPSILPQFRGASPIPATITTKGQVGVTIIKLDEKMDHGEIISQFKDKLLKKDTSQTIKERLFAKSAQVLKTLIPAYLAGKIHPKKQDHDKAVYTTLLKKEHGFISQKFISQALKGRSSPNLWEIGFIKDYFQKPTPSNIQRYIRAMQPWPQAWTYVKIGKKQKRLKLLEARVDKEAKKLVLDEVQLEGKKPVSWNQFIQGYPNYAF